MKTQPCWKPYASWVLASEAVGAASGFLIRKGIALYNASAVKPPLSPPPIVFPVVWTALYALMGVGMARVSLSAKGKQRRDALRAFWTQLALNFCWSILFFKLGAYGAAFFCLMALWAAILWTISAFRRADLAAARLQLPYLLWVTFAGYLNLGVWILNR